MFLALNRNAKARLGISLFYLSLILSSNCQVWGSTVYSRSELMAVETSEEGKVRDLRNQEITQLRVALGRRLPKNRRADLYFRVAEIYLETYRAAFLLEGRVHEKRIEKGVSDKIINRSYSRPYIQLGIKACKEILGLGIHSSKLDEIYYFLGFYYGELDQPAESAKYYDYLVSHYSGSIYVGAAAKELGEYFYNKHDFPKALRFLQLSLERSKPESKPPVLRKLAWCYYRTRQYEQSIATMKEAIASSNQFGDRFVPLKDECLQDLAVMMTERGPVEDVIRYFQEVARESSSLPRVLEKLGNQYERNVEISKAITVFEFLLKTHPNSRSAARAFSKLIELEMKRRNYSGAITRLLSFNPPALNDDETRSAIQNVRVLIRKTATEHHQAYRKKHEKKDLEIAESYYEAYWNYYLKKSDPHHEIPEIQMYLAEVKKDLGKSQEVVPLYRAVVTSKDKRYAKEAGTLWLGSIVEALKKSPSSKRDDPSELEKEFIEASDLMQPNMSEAKDQRESILHVAQVLAGYRNTRLDAIKRIRMILEKWPSTLQALTAAQLWVQLCLDNKDQAKGEMELTSVLSEIRANSSLMAADTSLNKNKLKNLVNERETKIKIFIIAQFEKDKNYVAAARAYEEFATTTQEKDLAEKAFENAVNSTLKTEDEVEPSLRLMGIWGKRFPKSPRIREPLRMVATRALIRGKYEVSAQIFAQLGTEYDDSESLETAARLYEGLGKTEMAQKKWSQFLDLYKTSPHRWRIALALAKSQDAAQLDREASHSYRYCAAGSSEFQFECKARLADLYLKSKDLVQAKSIYKQLSSQSVQSHSPFVAYGRFRLAELSENEATFSPLKLPEVHLQKALNERINFLEPLSRSYQSVMQAGGVWGIAGLHRLALFAMHFADEVDAIDPPSENTREKFRRNLVTVSGPLREKAKSTWNDGYLKAVSANIFSPVLPEVADQLADFRVSVPGRAQGPQGHFQLSGMAVDGASDGRENAFQKVRERLIQNSKDTTAWVDYGNLLWGEGKPLMAKIAYERTLSLQSRNVAALNNLAVVKLSSENEEDWVTATSSAGLLQDALKIDDFFIAAKMNLATLMNYYRLFSKAKPLWDQVLVKVRSGEAWSGLGIALQGTGNTGASEAAFQKAKDLGFEHSGFILNFHEAARQSIKGGNGANECLSLLEKVDKSSLKGFEKTAVSHLRGKCEQWKILN